MSLRLLQHPNPRHPFIHSYSEIHPGHPHGFEPPYECGVPECISCTALKKAREFINVCFTAQHQENSDEHVRGMFLFGHTSMIITFLF